MFETLFGQSGPTLIEILGVSLFLGAVLISVAVILFLMCVARPRNWCKCLWRARQKNDFQNARINRASRRYSQYTPNHRSADCINGYRMDPITANDVADAVLFDNNNNSNRVRNGDERRENGTEDRNGHDDDDDDYIEDPKDEPPRR